ncbi:ribonuclease HII [uncultured Sneathiella sp.]|jgi:ribonuclease HII|uniref:ribonuclease HII n=1 Tax=uncultured Sneathiella sp. TaxID=879315 RepID=UPI0030D8F039|tara:strand:- start:3177 stop:3794 length:618 start_codon:yes stop_codon:yes gene_type:complete
MKKILPIFPDLYFESLETGLIAGVDEVGRGPFAGPVVAAAVILNPLNMPNGIQDSKKLPKSKREELYEAILASSQVGIGETSVTEIDELNILQASLLAMRRAVAALPCPTDVALVDGNCDPKLGIPTRLIVKGDGRSLSIAAASIVAKVTRDRKMCALAEEFPHYGWEKNAGYGTAEHRKGLRDFGVSPQHRRSFAPIRVLLECD